MSKPPHVLIIRRRYLGDIVLLGSFIRNIKSHWPEAQIRVLIQTQFSGLIDLNNDVEEGIKMPSKKKFFLKAF